MHREDSKKNGMRLYSLAMRARAPLETFFYSREKQYRRNADTHHETPHEERKLTISCRTMEIHDYLFDCN